MYRRREDLSSGHIIDIIMTIVYKRLLYFLTFLPCSFFALLHIAAVLLVHFMMRMSYWHIVSPQKFGEVIALYPVMAARELKCWQLPGGNPP